MRNLSEYLTRWWGALVHPGQAGPLVIETRACPGLGRFLILLIVVFYAIYGFSMGLYRGPAPALISGLKLPFLFFFTLAICYPAFYVFNCLYGPRLEAGPCLRLLLLAISANAAALASYALISYFFTLTTSADGYPFLVKMHVTVFALAGVASVVVIALLFRAMAAVRGWRMRPGFLLSWVILYGFVGTQMSWILRPWIGSRSVPYTFFRPLGGSFIEAIWRLMN